MSRILKWILVPTVYSSVFFGSGYTHYFGNTETEQLLMQAERQWPGYQDVCRKASTSLTRSGSSLLLLNHVARR